MCYGKYSQSMSSDWVVSREIRQLKKIAVSFNLAVILYETTYNIISEEQL